MANRPHKFFLRVLSLALIMPWTAQAASGPALSDVQVRQRVEAILNKMTLEEKLGQLSLAGDPSGLERQVANGEVGAVLFVSDAGKVNQLQHLAVERSRVHIPLLFGFDVVHGFRTIFPVPIGMAASWDPQLAKASQSTAAREASAAGINWTFAPMVDIARDPRWGRIVEGAGEDPYLGSRFAAAQVAGFQGDYLGAPNHVMACVKHYAAYGAETGGRDRDDVNLSESQLQNVYLPPYHAAVTAGVGSIMTAYMDLNDIPATANRWLLHDVLRSDWGFDGLVVSDAGAAESLVNHHFARDYADAAALALHAGLDMEMNGSQNGVMRSTLADSLSKGKVTLAQIETADRYILAAKVRLGLFEHPYVDESHTDEVLLDPNSRIAARVAAERSAVLLRNQDHVLPLSTSVKTIAVLGQLADSKVDTLGSWSFRGDPRETVTIFEGLQSALQGRAKVTYVAGISSPRRQVRSPFERLYQPKSKPWSPQRVAAEHDLALSAVRASDVTILVLGEEQDMTGERASRSSLKLPGQQEEFLETIVQTGKPVVLVLMNGRPLDIRWASTHVPAILEAWYPGSQGGNAIANLLTGAAVPGGKLPFTWPRDEGQLPMNYEHNKTTEPELQGQRYWDEVSTPLYPFGYGQTYSSFTASNLVVDPPVIDRDHPVNVAAEITNTGMFTADQVVQLYIHQRSGTASRPVRQLKGFERVTLGVGERRTVHFSLGPQDLKYWNSASRSWVNDAANFDVWVGSDADASLHGSFEVN